MTVLSLRGPRRLPKRFLLSNARTWIDRSIITLGMILVSEANARGHWGPRAKRAAAQRGIAKLDVGGAIDPALRKGLTEGGLAITLTRVAPCELDDDNLRGACKALRDGVADALGLASDRDKRVTWLYEQAKDEPRTYGARVKIERRVKP